MSSTHKVAIITGASQGIGAGLVRGFLDRGYRVVANARSIEPAASADILAVAGNIADAAVADRVIGGAVEKFGRIDTLVNNAGIFIAKPFTEYTEADFAAKISVNLAGFFHISQRAVRQMLTQGGGHIVNLTTTLVNQPVKGVPSALASLTKGGLDAVTRSLAIEYADKGIRVNAVAPGGIQTPGARMSIEPIMHDHKKVMTRAKNFFSRIPLKRMGEPDDVARAIFFLCTPLAGYMTGTLVLVDGGFLLS